MAVKEYTGKREKAVEERKGWSRAVNKRGIKGRRLDVLLCDIVRTYATTSRAANRGLRAEGIPRLPPLTLILGEATVGCATATVPRHRQRRNRKVGVRAQSPDHVYTVHHCTPTQTRVKLVRAIAMLASMHHHIFLRLRVRLRVLSVSSIIQCLDIWGMIHLNIHR